MLRVLFASLLCALVQCMDYNLCGIKNISCSYQLWPNNSNTCEMQYFPIDSEECFSEFPESRTRYIPQYGIIKIEPFMAYKERRTVFRTTAYNITWNNLKIRFKQQNSNKCMKRKFYIKEPQSIAKDKYLIYDCPFSNSQYEARLLDFEYSYGLGGKFNGKRTFLVEVPLSDSLKNYNATILQNLKLFTYIETTDIYHLIYKIHKAPQIYVSFYEIYVNFTKNNYTRTEGPFVKSAEMAVLDVIDFEFDTFGVPGDYVFFVRPYECYYCEFSTSPTLIIPESSTILTIGIVGVSCLIPILMITLYMYVKIDNGLTPPRVLLVTTPANDAHKTITKSLAKLLREKYNIPTKLDILDIPLNSSIIPQEWLENSYEYATHIVILISDHKPTTSIYRNMDKILFNMKQDPEKQTCSIEFPFTEKPTTKFKVNRKFKFMRDYTSFINFILNRGFLRRIKDKFIKNDLYYCLLKEVENYEKNLIVQPSLNICDNECDENEQNCLKVDEVEVEVEVDERQVPLDKIEIVEELVNKRRNSDDDSDDSNSDLYVDPQVLSLLRNLP